VLNYLEIQKIIKLQDILTETMSVFVFFCRICLWQRNNVEFET